MTQKQKNFVQGAAILAVAGLIAKVIGALFRIPLTNIVGTEGVGYYQFAYPVYSLLLVISTAGLPAAISKLVAERKTNGDAAGAHDVFLVALRALLILGVICAVALFFLSEPIAALQKNAPAVYALMAISPALFFVSVISAYRGYFQGLQQMSPTAVSQVLEQLGKFLIGLTLAYLLLMNTREWDAQTGTWIMHPEYGAMGAMLGIAISETIVLLYLMVVYGKNKKKLVAIPGIFDKVRLKDSRKVILRQIVTLAIPVTLGACILPLMMAVDSVIVSRILQEIGYSQTQTAAMYGVLTGVVNSLVNLPAVLSLALAMSLVPAIAQSCTKNDMPDVRAKSGFALKLAILVGLPCMVGYLLLAQPIIMMLYHNIRGTELQMATGLLQIMSVGILFLTLVQTMTGVLQGTGRQNLPVISLVVGAVVKVVASVLLLQNPQVNIYGAAIGSVLCYMVAGIMDVVFAARTIRFSFSMGDHVLKPVVAAVVMGACAYGIYELLQAKSNALGTLLAILVGLMVYLFMLMLLGSLKESEVAMVPGGGKIEWLMKKMKIRR